MESKNNSRKNNNVGNNNGNKSNNYGNSKGLNKIEHAKLQLKELFPNVDLPYIEKLFNDCESDLELSITQLCEKTGREQIQELANLENEKSGFKLMEEQGDLFSCNNQVSYVHCVSVDLAMGKGIAVEFKKRFGKVEELKRQQQSVGGCAFILDGKQCQHVFYLITKPNYWDKPTYTSLRGSLEKLREFCESNNVNILAMPRIGCGLDGLIWKEVKRILKEVFWESNISVTIFRL
jgi:O-acetyl-ADP-ribose deacetylase (regulator of RNase III)